MSKPKSPNVVRVLAQMAEDNRTESASEAAMQAIVDKLRTSGSRKAVA